MKGSDINKKNIAMLRACAKTGKAAGQFIEVMACEGLTAIFGGYTLFTANSTWVGSKCWDWRNIVTRERFTGPESRTDTSGL